MTQPSSRLNPSIPSRHSPTSPQRNYSRLTQLSYATGPIWITLCHLGMAIAFFTGLSWGAIAWAVLWYWVRMLGTTAIYHRLLTHKAYQSHIWVKRIGSFITASAGQMGPSWWKAHHEKHHRFSDQPQDPHSSEKGFWWAHYRWLISPNTFPERLPADIEKDPIMRLIDRFHFVPLISLGLLSYWVGSLEYLGAFFISTTVLFHGVAFVNSVCHKFGTQPFVTTDHSRNNPFVAFLTLGEGWHNMHHAFGWAVRHGVTIEQSAIKYLPDPTYEFIRLLVWLGLAWKPKMPTDTDILAAAAPVAGD